MRAQDGAVGLVLEYFSRGTLQNMLAQQERRQLPPEDVRCLVLRPCIAALAYLHSRGISHHAVSDSALFLARDGTTKLGNFAPWAFRSAAADTATEPPSQSFNAAAGVWPRVPPEEVCPGTRSRLVSEQVCKGDIFALGLLAFELLVGRSVFEAPDGGSSLQYSPCEGFPGMFVSFPDFVPRRARMLLLSMLAINPLLRPSAAELACDPWLMDPADGCGGDGKSAGVGAAGMDDSKRGFTAPLRHERPQTARAPREQRASAAAAAAVRRGGSLCMPRWADGGCGGVTHRGTLQLSSGRVVPLADAVTHALQRSSSASSSGLAAVPRPLPLHTASLPLHRSQARNVPYNPALFFSAPAALSGLTSGASQRHNSPTPSRLSAIESSRSPSYTSALPQSDSESSVECLRQAQPIGTASAPAMPTGPISHAVSDGSPGSGHTTMVGTNTQAAVEPPLIGVSPRALNGSSVGEQSEDMAQQAVAGGDLAEQARGRCWHTSSSTSSTEHLEAKMQHALGSASSAEEGGEIARGLQMPCKTGSAEHHGAPLPRASEKSVQVPTIKPGTGGRGAQDREAFTRMEPPESRCPQAPCSPPQEMMSPQKLSNPAAATSTTSAPDSAHACAHQASVISPVGTMLAPADASSIASGSGAGCSICCSAVDPVAGEVALSFSSDLCMSGGAAPDTSPSCLVSSSNAPEAAADAATITNHTPTQMKDCGGTGAVSVSQPLSSSVVPVFQHNLGSAEEAAAVATTTPAATLHKHSHDAAEVRELCTNNTSTHGMATHEAPLKAGGLAVDAKTGCTGGVQDLEIASALVHTSHALAHACDMSVSDPCKTGPAASGKTRRPPYSVQEEDTVHRVSPSVVAAAASQLHDGNTVTGTGGVSIGEQTQHTPAGPTALVNACEAAVEAKGDARACSLSRRSAKAAYPADNVGGATRSHKVSTGRSRTLTAGAHTATAVAAPFEVSERWGGHQQGLVQPGSRGPWDLGPGRGSRASSAALPVSGQSGQSSEPFAIPVHQPSTGSHGKFSSSRAQGSCLGGDHELVTAIDHTFSPDKGRRLLRFTQMWLEMYNKGGGEGPVQYRETAWGRVGPLMGPSWPRSTGHPGVSSATSAPSVAGLRRSRSAASITELPWPPVDTTDGSRESSCRPIAAQTLPEAPSARGSAAAELRFGNDGASTHGGCQSGQTEVAHQYADVARSLPSVPAAQGRTLVTISSPASRAARTPVLRSRSVQPMGTQPGSVAAAVSHFSQQEERCPARKRTPVGAATRPRHAPKEAHKHSTPIPWPLPFSIKLRMRSRTASPPRAVAANAAKEHLKAVAEHGVLQSPPLATSAISPPEGTLKSGLAAPQGRLNLLARLRTPRLHLNALPAAVGRMAWMPGSARRTTCPTPTEGDPPS
jgi:hypothetical protein